MILLQLLNGPRFKNKHARIKSFRWQETCRDCKMKMKNETHRKTKGRNENHYGVKKVQNLFPLQARGLIISTTKGW